jgi:hypothetical protein
MCKHVSKCKNDVRRKKKKHFIFNSFKGHLGKKRGFRAFKSKNPS